MSTDAKLRKALKLAQSGRTEEAATIYNDILARFPKNTKARDGLARLAVPQAGKPATVSQQVDQVKALLQAGRIVEANALAKVLAKDHPKAPQAHALLAQTFMAKGDAMSAAKCLDRAARLAPHDIGMSLAHANALIQSGDFDTAARIAGALFRKAPHVVDAGVMEARALSEADRNETALERLKDLVEAFPNSLNVHLAQGNVLSKLSRDREAIHAFETALDIAPNDVGALNNLSNAYARQERFKDAIDLIEAALERAPGHLMLRENLAKTLQHGSQHERALDVLRGLLADAPNSHAVQTQIALCLWETGDRDECKRILTEVSKAQPDSLVALTRIGLYFPFDAAGPEVARLEAALDDPKLTQEARVSIEDALFQSYHKAGDTDRAFAYLKASRDHRETHSPYSMESLERVISDLQALFRDGNPFPDGPTAPEMTRPVFIVGMPRSGTTLVEQVLAGHPDVYAGGELLALQTAMREIGWGTFSPGPDADPAQLATIRQGFAGQIAQLAQDRPVLTDKMPLDFLWVGHALAAIPEARVLILDRDPMAVCWSNYSRHLVGAGNNFANRMDNLARTYRGFTALRDTWAGAFPDRVHIVDYGKLVSKPEEEAKAFVEAAELTWSDRLLDLGATKRAVRTASAGQVRAGIYGGSDDAWKAYEDHLAPLKAALGDLVP